MKKAKLLLTAVFGPYGVRDKYAERLGCQMELLNNQITREQGIHSPRQAYWSFGLYLMAENISVDTAVLDFPSWSDFCKELNNGYTHVGISFIVPNVHKARRMAKHIRKHHPEMKIILGGYGSVIEELAQLVPHDEVCQGEGINWLRTYFGDDPNHPIRHPVITGPAYEAIYGYHKKPSGGILLTGLGCDNGCSFCITSHKFKKKYVPLLKTGLDIFRACLRTEHEVHTTGFSVMDENFLKQPKRARELLALMEQHQKPYVFDLFSSAETILELGVEFLVRLGLHLVWIGVESQNNSFLKNKGIDHKALIAALQSHGISVQASSILFQDHHDRQSIQADIDWVIDLNSDLVQFMNYTPYPTTQLHQQMKREGRLLNVDYRHQHGQGQLNFLHPTINDPQEHIDILREAFRKKFEVGGPGVLNMAHTAIRGYQKVLHDHQARQRQALAWNPASLSYEPADKPANDEFMELRLRKMQKICINIRPVLLATKLFAPHQGARQKADAVIALYNQVLGKPSLADKTKALALVTTGSIESLRLVTNRLLGAETIVRQPPCKKTFYVGRSELRLRPSPIVKADPPKSMGHTPATLNNPARLNHTRQPRKSL